jgi:hypothetical protein
MAIIAVVIFASKILFFSNVQETPAAVYIISYKIQEKRTELSGSGEQRLLGKYTKPKKKRNYTEELSVQLMIALNSCCLQGCIL